MAFPGDGYEIDFFIEQGFSFVATEDENGDWFVESAACGYESNHSFESEAQAIGFVNSRVLAVKSAGAVGTAGGLGA